jgi:hypothetical protein
MPTSSEQDLESWIVSRKHTPAAHLANAVMQAIQEETQPVPRAALLTPSPSWLVASGCLLAGVGKFSLVFHLAF